MTSGNSNFNEIPCFDGWKIVKRLGGGSFGSVYKIRKVQNKGSNSSAVYSAMKVIPVPTNPDDLKGLLSDNGHTATGKILNDKEEEVLREVKAMESLAGCSNVVHYEDSCRRLHSDGLGRDILIRMECLTPLQEYLEYLATVDTDTYSGDVSDVAIQLGKDMCTALGQCEQREIIHRDIKPQNILVDKSANFKIGDFGVVRILGDGTLTQGTPKVGTYRYMAPEVYKGELYGKRADIYSVGMVLYWLLNERREPFAPLPPAVPSADERQTALARRMSGERLPPPAHGSSGLKDIVLKACAYKQEDRYKSANEMWVALDSLTISGTSQLPPPPEDTEEPETLGEEVEKPCSMPQEEARKDPTDLTDHHWKKYTGKFLPAAAICAAVFLIIGAIALGMYTAAGDSQVTSSNTTVLQQAEQVPEAAEETQSVISAPIVSTQSIACGIFGTYALKEDGTVIIAGSDYESSTKDIAEWNNVKSIETEGSCILGVKSDGTVVATDGWDEYGKCNVNVSEWSDIVAVAAGYYHTVGLKSDGTVVAVGRNDFGECNVSEWANIIAVAAGYSCTFGLKADGTVVSTGIFDVSGWKDIIAISAQYFHAVGLKADGTVVAAGDDGGDVSGWKDIVAVSAGCFNTVGLKADGTVVATGSNDYGQCNVSGWKDIVAIDSGECHTVGLKADGTVVAVGDNSRGQCDVSDWTDIRVPSGDLLDSSNSAVGSLAQVEQLSAALGNPLPQAESNALLTEKVQHGSEEVGSVDFTIDLDSLRIFRQVDISYYFNVTLQSENFGYLEWYDLYDDRYYSGYSDTSYYNYSYDRSGQLIGLTRTGDADNILFQTAIDYSGSGETAVITKSTAEETEILEYSFDSQGRPEEILTTDTYGGEGIRCCIYSEEGDLIELSISYDGSLSKKFTNTYDSAGKICESAVAFYEGPPDEPIEYKNGVWHYRYDTDGRLMEKNYTEEDTLNYYFQRLYYYNDDGTLKTEDLYRAGVLMYKRNFAYDANGNLTSETFSNISGQEFCSYEYKYSS